MNAPMRISEDTLRDKVVSTALWGAGVAWLVPTMGAMTMAFRFVPADRMDRLSRIYTRVQVALTGSKWNAVVHPAVDPEKNYLFAQNHTNHFDHVTMYDSTPHFKQGLELESHFDYPFYGWFMKARGTIPVPKDKTKRSAQIRQHMQAELDQGHSILAFPEGTRTVDGRVAPFRTGIFRIARDLGLPIAPTAVTGMYDVMRKGSLIIRPGNEVTVFVEEPIETAGVPDSEIADLAQHVREVIARRVDAYFANKEYGG